jgi:hypothetical protein
MVPPQLIFDPEGLYARLGVEPSASQDAIVAAFRRKARVLHPDIAGTGDADAFVAVKLAYDVLSNPDRRAAYDRSARKVRAHEEPPGEISSPAARFETIVSRQPRLSDLPIPVWVGMAAILSVGIVEVVLHMRAVPVATHQAEIRPNAPIVEPATPMQSQAMAYGPTPLRLAGTPNYYIMPTSSPTLLWHRDPARNTYVPGGLLPPFSSLQALRLFRQNGLVEVQVTETETGFVEAGRLTPGDATAARQAYCAYNAGTIPTDGEVLARNGSGSGHLEVVSRTNQPSVVKLRSETGAVAVSVFLAPSGHAEVDGLPDVRFRPEFAVGELWSRACQTFAAGMRAQRWAGYVPLNALAPLTVPPDLPGEAPTVEIPDQVFDKN